jgi:hypothetical protein
MKSAGTLFTQVTWSPSSGSFFTIDSDGKMVKLDMRTQEQREFDEAMAELEEWLKQP